MVAFNTAGAINIVGGVLSQDPNHLLVIESGGSLTVNGYSYVVLRAATIKSGGAITIAKGKTLRVIGELVVDQNATLTNDGDLLIYPDKTLTLNGGKLVNNGTVTFNANATLRSGSDETSLATIEQNGAFSFAAGSIISPGGDEAGGLAINGDIDLGKAKFLCDIKSKPYFDFIIIRGEASNLEFTVVPKWHYTPAQGSYFSIVKAEKGLKSKTLKFIEPPAPVAGLTVRYYFHKIPDFREEFYYISVR